MGMKKLAKLAFDHQKTTRQPLDTKLSLTGKDVRKLLKHLQTHIDNDGITDNIIWAGIFNDQEHDYASDISSSSVVYITFHFNFED